MQTLTPRLLILFERSALDKEEVEGLLQHVDHEESSQHQDLGHRKAGVREVARFERAQKYLRVE